MKKKILAAALAMTMVLGSSVSALATDTPNVSEANEEGVYAMDVTLESVVRTPKIEITVPTTMKVGINPYRMAFEEAEGLGESKEQIVSADTTIVNGSEVPVAVNVAGLTGAPADGSGIVLAAAAPAPAVTTKSAYIYLEATTEADFPDKVVPANMVVVASKAVVKDKLVTMDAKDGEKAEAKIRFRGSVATNPKVAWAEEDKLDLTLKFTFTPLVLPAE